MIVALKALHLATLVFWCAALLALPLTMKEHEPVRDPDQRSRSKKLAHGTYTRLATPAAVIAIGSGTALMFASGVFEPWMFAKLVAVALLVALHVRIGLELERMQEADGKATAPRALRLMLGVAFTIACVLALVLAKPAPPLNWSPDWLSKPRDQPMPVPEPPKR